MNKIYLKFKWVWYTILSYLFKKINVSTRSKFDFKINISSNHEVMRAKTFLTKEPEMIKWINSFEKRANSKSFTFYDIGANIGIYSLFSALMYPKAFIFSFEPEGSNFSSLCSNIFINKISNINPYQIGISDCSGFKDLHVGIMESGAGAAAINDDYKFVNSNYFFKQGLYCISLDDLVYLNNFKFPTFIKIDVDGHESYILKGAKKLLKDKRLKGIIIEFEYSNDNEKDKLIKYFKSNGLLLEKISEWVESYKNDNSIQIRNFLFKRE